ncbi:hypothetical protein [Carboxylicivirga marina]|uniref:Uncharacterized protein n=1 Tax=Carboxylicivirga marina TaxID=2800988 RepID=A0ABS1HLW0_9BACT|nr:hypothetical protein [Carboxylicivirga marina]MBK3518248.1 hypothetical protein [Carboxylicivirga marina]
MKQHNECLEVIEQFKIKINAIHITQPNPLPDIEKAMRLCQVYLRQLREKVYKGCIQNDEDEVFFFKTVKPTIVGHFLYF